MQRRSRLPAVKALLHIMAYGNYEGKNNRRPSVREMFTRKGLLASEWYAERLATSKARHSDVDKTRKTRWNQQAYRRSREADLARVSRQTIWTN